MSVHRLQELAVPLFESLYRDCHVTVTTGINEVEQGRYPDLKHVLSTLEANRDQAPVIDFCRAYRAEIDDAIEQVKLSEQESGSEAETREPVSVDPDMFSKMFDDIYNTPQPIELLKEIPLKDLDEALSAFLSQYLEAPVEVRLTSLEADPVSPHRASLALTVTSQTSQ
ncbi:MAG: hypothetical protein RJQ08_11055 [Salinisphaeraceae bacterium]